MKLISVPVFFCFKCGDQLTVFSFPSTKTVIFEHSQWNNTVSCCEDLGKSFTHKFEEFNIEEHECE